jgi:hypothetical protein
MSAKYNAQLTILNVHEEFMDKQEMTMLRVSVEQMQERFRDIAVKCREQMQKLVTSVGLDDLQVEYLIREGKADTTRGNGNQRAGQPPGTAHRNRGRACGRTCSLSSPGDSIFA